MTCVPSPGPWPFYCRAFSSPASSIKIETSDGLKKRVGQGVRCLGGCFWPARWWPGPGGGL